MQEQLSSLGKQRESRMVELNQELSRQIEDETVRQNLVEIIEGLRQTQEAGDMRDMPAVTITFGGGKELNWEVAEGRNE